MKQFEKWQPKFAKVKSSWELVNTYNEMVDEHREKICDENITCTGFECDCDECLIDWLDSEVEENDRP